MDVKRIQRLERIVLFVFRNATFDPHDALVHARGTQEDLAGVLADLKREQALGQTEGKA